MDFVTILPTHFVPYAHANKNQFKCSFYVLNFKLFCETCFSLGDLPSKINSYFHALQIEIVFPSCRPFQSEL